MKGNAEVDASQNSLSSRIIMIHNISPAIYSPANKCSRHDFAAQPAVKLHSRHSRVIRVMICDSMVNSQKSDSAVVPEKIVGKFLELRRAGNNFFVREVAQHEQVAFYLIT